MLQIASLRRRVLHGPTARQVEQLCRCAGAQAPRAAALQAGPCAVLESARERRPVRQARGAGHGARGLCHPARRANVCFSASHLPPPHTHVATHTHTPPPYRGRLPPPHLPPLPQPAPQRTVWGNALGTPAVGSHFLKKKLKCIRIVIKGKKTRARFDRLGRRPLLRRAKTRRPKPKPLARE